MADVARTPLKRKSFGDKQDSAKKQKIKTPKGGNQKPNNASPKFQNASPKVQKNNPKGQNGVPKTPKSEQKQKNKQTDQSPKKLKPFEGTKQIEGGPKAKKEKKDKKTRKSVFFQYKQILNGADEEAKRTLASTIEVKMKAISSRADPLTKTAKKKLNLLKRLKVQAEGGKPINPNAKTEASKSANKKNANPVAANKKENPAKQQKTVPQKQKQNQKGPIKKPKIEIEEDDDSDEEDDNDNDEELEEESDDEGIEEEEDDAEGEEDDDDDEEDDAEDESDEESEEDSPPPKQEKSKKSKKTQKQAGETQPDPRSKSIDIEQLQKNDIVGKNQHRYVLFVGNIPYDTQKEDLKQHFGKCGQIKHIRIPTEKQSSKPRGFAYVELEDAETYQKCMSMHHTFLKGRRINVLYTMGGKKKGEEKKKEIKSKNFKLHAMRKQGQLAGSKKETQKRSFRRKKVKQANSEPKSE